jgi:hypothetical protein
MVPRAVEVIIKYRHSSELDFAEVFLFMCGRKKLASIDVSYTDEGVAHLKTIIHEHKIGNLARENLRSLRHLSRQPRRADLNGEVLPEELDREIDLVCRTIGALAEEEIETRFVLQIDADDLMLSKE